MNRSDGWKPIDLETALGSAEDRFFGSGYRRVRHELRPLDCHDGSVEVIGRVSYPDDWSVRGGGRKRAPHLSTIDAVVLPLIALECSEWSASALRTRSFVSRVTLRAGSRPWLDLDHVPVRLACGSAPGSPGNGLTCKAMVGNIHVALEISSSDYGGPALSAAERAGCKERSVYSELYQSVRCETKLADYHPDSGELVGHHVLEVSTAQTAQSLSGIEGAYWPAVTVVDYIVTMGQLTQALIATRYNLDRVGGDLWMRSVDLKLPSSPVPTPAEVTTVTKPLQEKVIERAGRRIRSIIIDSRASNGVSAEAKLAYTETT